MVTLSQGLQWDRLPASLLVVGDDYVGLRSRWLTGPADSTSFTAGSGRSLVDTTSITDSVSRQGVFIRRATEFTTVSDHVGGAASVTPIHGGVGAAYRRPKLGVLDLAAAGLGRPSGPLPVDAQLRLDRHVFAIGDVTPGLLLAHRAMMQGRVVGEVLGGRIAALDATAFPRAVFVEPEIASVGLTEAAATASGREISVGRFPLMALGRAVIEPGTHGFAKLVFEAGGGPLLGAHLAGPRATELIAEMALAIEMSATAEDLALTVHAHPTFAEALMEAAEVSLGRPIHVRPSRNP